MPTMTMPRRRAPGVGDLRRCDRIEAESCTSYRSGLINDQGSPDCVEDSVVVLRSRTELGAVVAVEGDLADSYGRGSHLEALVLAAELEGLLQLQVACRHEALELVARRLTDVG